MCEFNLGIITLLNLKWKPEYKKTLQVENFAQQTNVFYSLLVRVCSDPAHFCLLLLVEAPTSTCHFFRPSIRPSVAHHISGTLHHLIIIFGTRM